MSDTFTVAKTIIAIAIILLIYQRGFVSLRRDTFRCDIRRIRDSLFDFMLEHNYEFSHPGYVDTRRILNGLLRLSNDLGPVSTLVRMWYKMRVAEDASDLFPHTKCSTDPVLLDKLNSALAESLARTMRFVWFEGPSRVVTACLFAVIKILGKSVSIGEQASESISATAYWVGGPTLDAQQRMLIKA